MVTSLEHHVLPFAHVVLLLDWTRILTKRCDYSYEKTSANPYAEHITRERQPAKGKEHSRRKYPQIRPLTNRSKQATRMVQQREKGRTLPLC